jgi:hypothetical protein
MTVVEPIQANLAVVTLTQCVCVCVCVCVYGKVKELQ